MPSSSVIRPELSRSISLGPGALPTRPENAVLTESAEPLFTCDLGRSGEELPHFWEHTVGSGHAALALRADWQAQMARCRRELGFRRVRFHGLLDEEMGTLSGEKGKPVYSFFNADCLWDFLLAIDMRPFVELSFMPTTLASGSTTVFHYRANVTPPTRDAEWEALIQKLARHWLDRYGAAEVEAWLFEVLERAEPHGLLDRRIARLLPALS